LTESDDGLSPGKGVVLERKIVVKKPSMYKVVLHNDNFTTMEFVIDILINIFQKKPSEATKIMFDVHKNNRGVAGIYTLNIAQSKIKRVHELARKEGFPLKCSHEKV